MEELTKIKKMHFYLRDQVSCTVFIVTKSTNNSAVIKQREAAKKNNPKYYIQNTLN